MNAIGNSNRPVFINAKGVPQECNENPKNAALVGTDANGALANRSLGFLLENSGGVIKVKNNIPDSQIPAAGSGNVLPVGIDANRQLVPASSPTNEDHGIGPDSLGNYTEVVPYWGYINNTDLVEPSKGETVVAPSPWDKVSCFRTNESDDVYQYTVSIPTWTGGRSKMCSIDFCCQGNTDNLADMRVWLISGSKAVNILKQHSFNYGYNDGGSAHFTNSYSSCNLVIPIKSGVNLRFDSSRRVRHMHILLFNV